MRALFLTLASLPTAFGYLPRHSRASSSLRNSLQCPTVRRMVQVALPAHAESVLSCASVCARNLRNSAAGLRCASSGASTDLIQLQIEQFPCLSDKYGYLFHGLSDNYGYLIHDASSGLTAAIDTPEVDAYMEALERKGWKLSHIINTHHHHDHAGGNLELKKRTGCTILGPVNERDKIPGLDVALGGGDGFDFGAFTARVLDVGGHTKGHIALHFSDQRVAFVGDALFAMGCGRMFEGTYDQMFQSMVRLGGLPDDTTIYCAHEYTLANAKFAASVEPSNARLQERLVEVQDKRQRGEPTVPTQMGLEKATNPFLRYASPEIRKVLGVTGASDVEAFAAIRKAKDTF